VAEDPAGNAKVSTLYRTRLVVPMLDSNTPSDPASPLARAFAIRAAPCSRFSFFPVCQRAQQQFARIALAMQLSSLRRIALRFTYAAFITFGNSTVHLGSWAFSMPVDLSETLASAGPGCAFLHYELYGSTTGNSRRSCPELCSHHGLWQSVSMPFIDPDGRQRCSNPSIICKCFACLLRSAITMLDSRRRIIQCDCLHRLVSLRAVNKYPSRSRLPACC
jgi:hypothetical protein